mgnify:CR=1 FL=1
MKFGPAMKRIDAALKAAADRQKAITIDLADWKAKNAALEERIRQRPGIGMAGKEKSKFSITRCIIAAQRKNWDGAEFERDAIAATAKELGMAYDVKTLQLGNDTSAGFLVPNEVLTEVIDLKRNTIAIDQLGVMRMSGLTHSPIEINRQTGAATAGWIGEGTAATRTDQTFDKISLSPHKCYAATQMSNTLLRKNAVQAVEGLVRKDLAEVLIRLQDLAFFEGSGVAGQPRGMAGLAGNTVTFTAADDAQTRLVRLQQMVEETEIDNIALAGCKWVMPVQIWHDINQIIVTLGGAAASEKISVGMPMQAYGFNQGDISKGQSRTLFGYPVVVTSNLTVGANVADLYFGDWSDCIAADWGAPFIRVTSEGQTLALADETLIVAFQEVDNHLRHANAICLGDDYEHAPD